MSHSAEAVASGPRCKACGELAQDCECNRVGEDGGILVPRKFTPYLEAEGMVYLDDPRIAEMAKAKQ